MREKLWRPTKIWWKNYGALCGEQAELSVDNGSPEVKKINCPPSCPTEVEEQIVVASWLMKKNVPFYHVPNGGFRDYREAAKFKRMGVRSGVPDLCICVSRKGYHGLYIELKRVFGGRLSETQIFWRDILLGEGYFWSEGKGAAECIKIIEDYIN